MPDSHPHRAKNLNKASKNGHSEHPTPPLPPLLPTIFRWISNARMCAVAVSPSKPRLQLNAAFLGIKEEHAPLSLSRSWHEEGCEKPSRRMGMYGVLLVPLGGVIGWEHCAPMDGWWLTLFCATRYDMGCRLGVEGRVALLVWLSYCYIVGGGRR